MIGSENGAAAETLPAQSVATEIEDQPAGPGLPSEPPGPSRPGGDSRFARRLTAAVVALALLTAAVVVVLLASSSSTAPKSKPKLHPVGPHALTAAQIAALGKASSVMVVAEGTPDSPIVQLLGGGRYLGFGSGWYYGNGLIVTDAHVIRGATKIQVGTNRANLTDATVVAVDAAADVAVVRVPQADLPGLKPLSLAPTSGVQIGTRAYVLGFPPGNSNDPLSTQFQATQGQVTSVGVNFTIDADPLDRANPNADQFLTKLFQTDAAANPGNSGGAVVNGSGQVIGMTEAGDASAHTRAYATSVSELATVVPMLVSGKSHDYSGFDGIPLTPDEANSLGVSGGVLITSVVPGTPADVAGLGDLISSLSKDGALILLTKVDSSNVDNFQELIDALNQIQSGEQFTIDVVAVVSQGVVPDTGHRLTLTAP